MLNLLKEIIKLNSRLPVTTIVRHARTIKNHVPEEFLKFQEQGPEFSKSLSETLSELNKVDPLISYKVDIGFPPKKITKAESLARIKHRNEIRNNPEIEKQARHLTLNIDLDAIRQEWIKTLAPQHIKTIAEHYNIYDDLYGDAYFTPNVVMNIYYLQKNTNLVASVCRGNVIKPSEAFVEPGVEFDSGPEDLWTLTLVCPDGHLTEPNMEYVHWFVGNIPGNNVAKGEVIWDYLPPFPSRGVGFQRYVFILYKQDKKIDYSNLKQIIPCLELKNRSFKTLEFYRERQDFITPAGLSFFQSDWDKTSRKIFHEILNMEEPVFEYDIKPKEYNKQRWFPKKKPFNLYLDRYRDPRDIAQEYLLKKLKEIDPFQPPKKPYPYPKIFYRKCDNMPSWLVNKEIRYKLGRGRASEIIRDEYE